MRRLGIDMGGRRTGVALSDPHGIICSPLEVITETDREALFDRIIALIHLHGVDELVVGLPRPLGGGVNRQVEEVLAFVDTLQLRSGVKVNTWDERFTSKLAGKTGPKTGPRDAVAACYMLQNYLDAQTNAEVTGEQ